MYTYKTDTLWELLNASAAQFGPRDLFGTRKPEGGWSWITYSQFLGSVDRTAARLRALDVAHGDRVAYIGPNSVDWATFAFATFSLGAVFVPMYDTQTDEEWRHIIADSGAEVLIVAEEKALDRVMTFRHKIDSLWRIYGLSLPSESAMAFHPIAEGDGAEGRPAADDIACIIYTSGTTGTPKGVVLSHRNIMSNVLASRKRFPLTSDDRCVSFLPWAHAFGQTAELHIFISLGASIAINGNVGNLIRDLGEVSPTILCAVPRIFNKLYANFHANLASVGWVKRTLARTWPKTFAYPKLRKKLGGRLRFCISGGARLEEEIGLFLDEAAVDVYEGYGLSETSPVVAMTYPGCKRLGTVGTTIEGVGVVIDTSVTGDPKEGEIIVYGPNVFQGYWNDLDATRLVLMPDGGFRTGDLGFIDTDGKLIITGRIKDLYKLSNGKYVAPVAIEEKIKLSPMITNVMVWGANKAHNVALVVPINGASEQEILAEIDRLTADGKPWERIKAVALVTEDFTQENGMLTPTLKLKRRVVLGKYQDRLEALYR